MIDDLNLDQLRKAGRIGYYFRYPLHRNNFHELRIGDQLWGHFTAKPLYGRLTPEGRVDRSAGFNGDVAVLFVPLDAKDITATELILIHTNPETLLLPNGKRDWKEINEVATAAVSKKITETGSSAW
ncbi:MAG: hypothetical protein J7539_02325 [Niabella sp.]|nr:hypothetical protein [Niabella sp.]